MRTGHTGIYGRVVDGKMGRLVGWRAGKGGVERTMRLTVIRQVTEATPTVRGWASTAAQLKRRTVDKQTSGIARGRDSRESVTIIIHSSYRPVARFSIMVHQHQDQNQHLAQPDRRTFQPTVRQAPGTATASLSFASAALASDSIHLSNRSSSCAKTSTHLCIARTHARTHTRFYVLGMN